MTPTNTSRAASTVERENPVLYLEEDVRHYAYELYVQRGREDGHALEDWLRAEELVKQTRFRSVAA